MGRIGGRKDAGARAPWVFRGWDAAAAALVILAAAGILILLSLNAGGGGAKSVMILQNRKMIRELALDTDAEVHVGGEYTCTVTVRDGRVCVSESNCPGEDCVHTGWIDQEGRSIVCLPNRLEVRISGQDAVDIVVR